MYRTSVTEEEAKLLGARRWKLGKGVKRHYLKWSLISAGVGVVFGILACLFTGVPSLVLAFFCVAALGCAVFFPYRMDYLATKAGKTFFQSLKEEE
jgi:Flp pilus assembly protein TadB